MSEAQMRRISYLRSIVKDRDAEIERLRAALERLAKRCEDDFNGGRKLRRADVVKARAALDGQPAPGKEEA